jgi:hypothetical protein
LVALGNSSKIAQDPRAELAIIFGDREASRNDRKTNQVLIKGDARWCMSWFEVVVLIFIVWGGSSFALSLRQLKTDVEWIKNALVREEVARERKQLG